MQNNNLFDDTSVVHQDSLRLCFMHIVQDDLNSVREEWNSHLIRPSKGSCSPSGHPDELYSLPHILGTIIVATYMRCIVYLTI